MHSVFSFKEFVQALSSVSFNFLLVDPKLDSVNKKVHFSPHIQTDSRQTMQTRARLYPSGGKLSRNGLLLILLSCRKLLQVNLFI